MSLLPSLPPSTFAQSAIKAVVRRAIPNPNRRPKLGKKEIFLPNHVVTMIRPPLSPRETPYRAHFIVPLTFNKFDMRDYLWNAYGVGTTAIRSYLRQLPLRQKGGRHSPWSRPPPEKRMIAELVKPFVWPDPPKPEDRKPWDYDIDKKVREIRKVQEDLNVKRSQSGEIPFRTAEKVLVENKKKIEDLAAKFLSGEMQWTNNSELDAIWKGNKSKFVGERRVPLDEKELEGLEKKMREGFEEEGDDDDEEESSGGRRRRRSRSRSKKSKRPQFKLQSHS